MINFFLKLLVCPGVIFLADAISPKINYSNSWQVIYTGLFIGVIAYIADIAVLKRLGSGVSALIDFVVAAIIVYLSQYFANGVVITFAGAILGGALVGISEYLTHRLILGDKLEEKPHTVR